MRRYYQAALVAAAVIASSLAAGAGTAVNWLRGVRAGPLARNKLGNKLNGSRARRGKYKPRLHAKGKTESGKSWRTLKDRKR